MMGGIMLILSQGKTGEGRRGFRARSGGGEKSAHSLGGSSTHTAPGTTWRERSERGEGRDFS